MAASLNEPFLVGDPFVSQFEDRFHMFYIYGLRWIKQQGNGQAERVYKIAHAVSVDGREWVRDSIPIIPDRLGPNECQALPTVIHAGGKYHMYFCYRYPEDFRSNRERGYRLGYATSSDMQNWLRDDSNAGIDVANTGWDSEMQCYPHLFSCEGNIYLLYNGNNFGRNGFGIALLEDM